MCDALEHEVDFLIFDIKDEYGCTALARFSHLVKEKIASQLLTCNPVLWTMVNAAELLKVHLRTISFAGQGA